jgi:hypothetical protein
MSGAVMQGNDRRVSIKPGTLLLFSGLLSARVLTE